jgi:hypothetical protein
MSARSVLKSMTLDVEAAQRHYHYGRHPASIVLGVYSFKLDTYDSSQEVTGGGFRWESKLSRRSTAPETQPRCGSTNVWMTRLAGLGVSGDAFGCRSVR